MYGMTDIRGHGFRAWSEGPQTFACWAGRGPNVTANPNRTAPL